MKKTKKQSRDTTHAARRGKKVLAFGTFDILHAGHVAYLEAAKRLAGKDGKLVVIVARDHHSTKAKGFKPYFDQNPRLTVVRALRAVDRARLGVSGERFTVLVQEKPDVIALGYDQRDAKSAVQAFLDAHGLNAKIVRLKAKNPAQLKSHRARRHYRL